MMHLVPDSVATSSRGTRWRRSIRWVLLAIAAVLVLEHWRLIAAVIAIVVALSAVLGFVMIVALLRTVTRPIERLSLADVAFVTWLYRRVERRHTTRETDTSSNIRDLRPR